VPAQTLTIGELARSTGVATSALRYYEDLGLLRPARRTSGHRSYDPQAVAIVGVVLFLRDVGFTLKEIKRMVTRRSAAPRVWKSLATRKVAELDQQIAKAQAARIALEHALACPRENILECPNFWNVVGGLLAGKTLEQAHPV
jgi:DNA-binding transcriptional MerR regulator